MVQSQNLRELNNFITKGKNFGRYTEPNRKHFVKMFEILTRAD